MDEPIQMDIKIEEEQILCQDYQQNIINSPNIHLEKTKKQSTKDGSKDFESISALSTNYCDMDNDDYDDDGEEHECTLCARLFQSEKLFKVHIKEHAKLDGLLSDSGGEEEFQTIKEHDTKNADHQSIPSEKSAHNHTNAEEGPYKCLFCPKEFATKRQLQYQYKYRVHPPFSEIPHKQLPSRSKRNSKHLRRFYFHKRKSVETHLYRHKRGCPYKCDICSKSFPHPSHLEGHMRTHTGKRPYECDICSKTFKTLGELKCHKRTHSGERPFTCETCSKSFHARYDLKKHMFIHTGGHPYECEICSKKCSELSKYKVHMRVHTGERPYKCDQCSKTFKAMGNLTEHMRVHTEERRYKCELCSKTFKNMSHLTRHKRTHSGERPFTCETCSKSFSDRSALNDHMRAHTGESPDKCEV